MLQEVVFPMPLYINYRVLAFVTHQKNSKNPSKSATNAPSKPYLAACPVLSMFERLLTPKNVKTPPELKDLGGGSAAGICNAAGTCRMAWKVHFGTFGECLMFLGCQNNVYKLQCFLSLLHQKTLQHAESCVNTKAFLPGAVQKPLQKAWLLLPVAKP